VRCTRHLLSGVEHAVGPKTTEPVGPLICCFPFVLHYTISLVIQNVKDGFEILLPITSHLRGSKSHLLSAWSDNLRFFLRPLSEITYRTFADKNLIISRFRYILIGKSYKVYYASPIISKIVVR